MRLEVEKVLDRIRPALQADGGDVELVDVDGGVVKVRLTGACGGCPMATMPPPSMMNSSMPMVSPLEVVEIVRHLSLFAQHTDSIQIALQFAYTAGNIIFAEVLWNIMKAMTFTLAIPLLSGWFSGWLVNYLADV